MKVCPPSHRHGATMTCYAKHKCRCDACLSRKAETGRADRARLAPPEGGICPPHHRHETTSTCYGTHGCRCVPCRERYAEAKRASRERLAAKSRGQCPPEHPHGATQTCYNSHKCRCEACIAKKTGGAARYKRRAAVVAAQVARFDAKPVDESPEARAVLALVARRVPDTAEAHEVTRMLGVAA